jgi:hypothetical protein
MNNDKKRKLLVALSATCIVLGLASIPFYFFTRHMQSKTESFDTIGLVFWTLLLVSSGLVGLRKGIKRKET